MNEVLTWLLDLVQSVDPVLRTILAGVGILLETSVLVGLIVPGDSIVIVASTAIDSVVEYVAMLAAVVLGALGGESIGFMLGRYFGPRIRASRLGRRIGEKQWVRAENYTDRRAGVAVFISRFLPVLHSLVPLTAGMSSMRYRTFMAWTVPACLLWAGGYVTVGWLAAGSYRELADQLHYAGYIFVAVIVAFLLLVVLAKYLLGRAEARYMRRAGDGDASTIDD
ncbi:DedA family protein [Salinibacterium sp. dk2585]|uniref:DedA family protein n=1 Tax=unclassified Salinibacterium TaxID=2632331 RepID=UPI0011C24495|nr:MULTISPECIES: DedA family protein [unclassified Salinibacterium]QEE61414.1 DedA family protein [Salinibacterium sp. dk2585]TXK54091.1 DedA family protein [Salinibacterium sp. dk5596]